MVKHLSIMQETWVQSLGWEDPLKKEMALHSSTIAWKIPWTEEPDRLQSMGSQRVRHNWVTSLSLFKTQTVVMYGWELDCEESWAPKNWCFRTVVLEKTLESPLDCKEIQPVHPKRKQSWVFIGRTDIEAETPILWYPNAKSWLIVKDPDAGKDWRQEEKGMTEYETVGWHHWLNGHESEYTPGVGDGQRGLVCCGSWGCKESDTSEWLNWLNVNGEA